MRLTHSADFTAYLGHHRYDIDALVGGPRQRLAQNDRSVRPCASLWTQAPVSELLLVDYATIATPSWLCCCPFPGAVTWS
jgi:hypothetical protein